MPTLGTCAVCERPIRVRTGKMVHHGYARPGRGHIVGDCFAVHRAPYEVSCDATRDYRRVTADALDRSHGFLVRLRSAEVHSLGHEVRVPVPTTAERTRRRDPGWTTWIDTVTDSEDEPQRRTLWRLTFNRIIGETEDRIRMLSGEVGRCDRLIRDWRPGELREVPRAPAEPRARRRRRRLFFARQS